MNKKVFYYDNGALEKRINNLLNNNNANLIFITITIFIIFLYYFTGIIYCEGGDTEVNTNNNST